MELLQKELIFYTLILVGGFFLIFHCILLVWKKGVTTASFMSRIATFCFSTIPIIWVTFYISETPFSIDDYILLLIPLVITMLLILLKDSKSYEVKLMQYDYKQVFQVLESSLSKYNFTYKQREETEPGTFYNNYKTTIHLENGQITVSWKDKKNPIFIILFQKFKDKDLRKELISLFREEIQTVNYAKLIGLDLIIGIAFILYSSYKLIG